MKKRAGDPNYKPIIKKNGARDWAPINPSTRAVDSAREDSHDIRSDFGYDHDDMYGDEEEFDTEDLLHEDLENGLNEIIDRENRQGAAFDGYDDPYDDHHDYEGFGDYGDLSERHTADDVFGDYQPDTSSDDYFGYTDEWN